MDAADLAEEFLGRPASIESVDHWLAGDAEGYRRCMTNAPDESAVDSRAELLPEEEAAGSDSPHDQAQVILEESLERTDDPQGSRHDSAQTPGG